ncbi:urease accessory protein UreD [Anaeromyxobacter oryzisoli]|uniref:urease accessory protein UreD n=1 Tax=Anaeromyxobacter oryzisoli TaxID=2925408 RepID=UPI001F57A7C3|nr:urease accessory protein UreD [Anaeromyxobacter sp. SG63]
MDCTISEPIGATPARRCPLIEQRRPESGLRAGAGRIETAQVDGASALVACAAASPLQLLSPSPRGRCAWVVQASHGGGLVAGDDVSLDVAVGAGSTALLSTQAGTKVYRSRGAVSSQRLTARIASNGVLAVLPQPVSCFAGARFHQDQRFALAPGASLLWLDALVAGRVARGERWAFDAYRARVEIAIAGRTVLADALRLVPGEGPPVPRRLEGVDFLATVVALGPAVAPHAAALRDALAAAPADGDAPVLAAASPLADGVLLRVASRSAEAGLAFVRRRLAFVEAVAGADPFARIP